MGVVIFFLLFGPQFGLIIMGAGREGKTTLDPPLISYHRMSLTSLMNMGAFHLSELTGQTFSVAMIISFLLIKTLQLNQSNPK